LNLPAEDLHLQRQLLEVKCWLIVRGEKDSGHEGPQHQIPGLRGGPKVMQGQIAMVEVNSNLALRISNV